MAPIAILERSSTLAGVQDDWAAEILTALATRLSDEDHHLIRRVDVTVGWGRVHFVDVYPEMSRSVAGSGFEEAIRKIVREVLYPLRYSVRIIWPG